MFSWLMVSPMTLVSAKVSIRLISLAGVGIGTSGKSPSTPRAGACWRMTPWGWLPRRMKRRREVGGVAERALALDDDHVGVLALEGLDDGGLHLAGAELARDGVEGDAVAGALDEAGLAGADQHGLDAPVVERLGEDGGGGALADGAVGAEHGDARAGHLGDAAAEHAQVLLVAWAAHVEDRRRRAAAAAAANSGSSLRNSWRPLTMLMPASDRVEHDAALGRREHAARRAPCRR